MTRPPAAAPSAVNMAVLGIAGDGMIIVLTTEYISLILSLL